MLQYNNKNGYMLIQDQKSMMTAADDNMSTASTLVPTIAFPHRHPGQEKSAYSSFSVVPDRKSHNGYDRSSSSINSLCRRISSSIKRNFQDSIQSRRESRREKRPQDGKTNPME